MERFRDGLLLLVLFLAGAASFALLEGGSRTSEPPLSRPAVELKSPVSEGALSAAEIYKRDAPGVVSIATADGRGSGFLISRDGEILTNSHVVHGADEIRVSFSDGENHSARVVGDDPSTDLALIQIEGSVPLNDPLKLGDSSNLIVGDGVVAIGNPFGLEQTLTTGVVSALQRTIESPDGFAINQIIQTDAAINPGNSGGPLLNAYGDVIGINSQIASTSGQSSGIGFAIPINLAKSLLPALREGSISHGFLGVSVREQADKDQGLLVESVTPGSAAADAGIVKGDSILEVNGQSVSSVVQLQRLVSQRVAGDVIGVKISTDTGVKTVMAKLTDRDASDSQ